MSWASLALLLLGVLVGMLLGAVMTAVWIVALAVKVCGRALDGVTAPQSREWEPTPEPARTGEPAGWAN